MSIAVLTAACGNGPSPAARSGPTQVPTPSPTANVTPTPALTPAPPSFEQQLLSAHPPSGYSCTDAGSEVLGAEVLRQVTCESVAGDAPKVVLTTYASSDRMNSLFDVMPTGSESAATCTGGDFFGRYSVDGADAGKLSCHAADPTDPRMSWTVDRMLVSVFESPPDGWTISRVYQWWLSVHQPGSVAVTPATPPVQATPSDDPIDEPTDPPMTFAKLTSRQWARLVKAPDDYTGNGYVVWACITQFDAATGDDAFRAQASYAKIAYWYSDGTNAYFSGTGSGSLDPFVQNDVVLMNVVALGSTTYTTTLGGSVTVPEFEVEKITRKGSC